MLLGRVFISHSSADKVLAHAVAEKIKSWGFGTFLSFDREGGIVGGAAWEAEILTAIRTSDVVLLCFTESARDNLWCFGEMLIARYERKPIIPLLLHGPQESIWEMVRNSVQYVDITHDPVDGYARLRSALDRVATPHVISQDTSQTIPYTGLTPLSEREAGLYFGRDRDLQAVLGRLRPTPGQREPRILAVTGPSGSGKSSLIAAGLLPALRRGAVTASDQWCYVNVAPGEDPIRRLAEALRQECTSLGVTREIVRQLAEDEDGLGYVFSDVLADTGKKAVCLIIDQFEELATLSDEGRAELFLQGILGALNTHGPDRIVVILTVRIDQLSTVLAQFDKAGRFFAKPFLLSSLGREDLVKVIQGPAQALGWFVDPDLVARLVNDASGVSDPLPLLSFVLRLMADTAGDIRELTLRDYERTGGLGSALGIHAEAAFAHIPEDRQSDVVSLIVSNLVAISSDGAVSKRPCARSAFPATANPAIESLISQRLLVAGVDASGSPTVDITHEALLRNWPRIREKIELMDADVRYSRRLLQGARETWKMRRKLPSVSEGDLILDQMDHLEPSTDEVEVMLRWALAERKRLGWVRPLFQSDPELARSIMNSIVGGDSGLAQYGMLTSQEMGKFANDIDALAAAEELVHSSTEAIRRASRRLLNMPSDDESTVRIPAGSYPIGDRAAPMHVPVKGFEISKFLVTNIEFAQFVMASRAIPPHHWNRSDPADALAAVRDIADYPVTHISYQDALAYCEFCSTEEWLIRLPTEIEWEIAMTFSSESQCAMSKYPWGDLFDARRCNTAEAGVRSVTPIGLYSTMGGDSPAGISDLSGNVWEWTSSRGREMDGTEVTYPSTAIEYDADDARSWAPRVQRGGTFLADSAYATRTFRLVNLPELALQDFGFRVVRVPRSTTS